MCQVECRPASACAVVKISSFVLEAGWDHGNAQVLVLSLQTRRHQAMIAFSCNHLFVPEV